uniref:EGF-like domain-containing protein n=1 Tax=Timema shepardi TaxID=629360 RepID=A0A7R9AXN7_TIMSH|nr:unnamed protein product [Timema shepardi]
MASLVLTDSSQMTAESFEKLPDQIMYPYAEPYDLQKHKADPTQFLQLHGRPAKIHLDPTVAIAGDSPANMMPWQGHQDILVDRFDVRAHLDYIPENVMLEQASNETLSKEDRLTNYERYRIIVQNDFLGVAEEKFLHQLYLEEQFGPVPRPNEDKKKRANDKAAIPYTYEDTPTPITEPEEVVEGEEIKEPQEEEDDDSDIDFDLCVDVSLVNPQQAHELNTCGADYGMTGTDFFSFLTRDVEEKESLRLAREQEEEKAMYSGRKSRRERRAFREKRLKGRKISPPSYAARTSPTYDPYRKSTSKSRSRSRSVSPVATGQITYITSFGGEEEAVGVPKPGPSGLKAVVNPGPSGHIAASRSRTPPKSGVKWGPRTKDDHVVKAGPQRKLSSSPDRSRYRSRESSSHNKPNQSHSSSRQRLNRSRSNSHQRPNRSRSGSRQRLNRSRSNSHQRLNRSRSSSRQRSNRSRSNSHQRSNRSRSNSRQRSNRSRSNSRQRSNRSRSNSRQRFRRRYSSSTSSRGSTRSGGQPEGHNPAPPPPVRRYYGRRGASSSSELDLSDTDSDKKSISTVEHRSSNSSLSKISNSGLFGNSGAGTKVIHLFPSIFPYALLFPSYRPPGGEVTRLLVLQSKATPQERLKRKMQVLLNKQYKADKRAERERYEKQEQERQDREDELREMAIKLRRREREKRHRMKDSGDEEEDEDLDGDEYDEEGEELEDEDGKKRKRSTPSSSGSSSRTHSPEPTHRRNRWERTEVDMEMRHRGERDSSASHWERENYRGRETQREGYQERYRDTYRERDRSRECSPPRRPRPRLEPMGAVEPNTTSALANYATEAARDVMSRLWLILICIVVVIPFSLAARFVPKWKKQACEIPASQNEHSHYVCTDNGDVKCLPGWMGDLCDVPMCKKGCDPLQGYCKRPGECRCKLGFYGEMCNKCIALPGCQHGNCNNSFECNCQEGWDGLFCSELTVMPHEAIVSGPENAGVDWVGLAKYARNARSCLAANTATAPNHSSVAVIAVIRAFCARLPFVPRVVTRNEDTAENQESADAKLDGGERSVTSATLIPAVFTASAIDPGSVTASPVGGACSVTKLANALVVLSSTVEDGEIEVRISVG